MNEDISLEEVLMVKVSWYYYIEGMTQQKISELLDISRIRVIKLLEKARQTGIIQFKIREDRAGRMETERKLITSYGLKDAFVVPTAQSAENVNANIAKAAAIYLFSKIDANSAINIGYGDTASKILNNLAAMTEYPITCISLTGGVSHYLPNTQSQVFNVKLNLMPIPLLVSSKELAAMMRNEPSVMEISRMIKLSDMSVVGIGAMTDTATVIKSSILSTNDFLYLKLGGAVGDILSHFIDKDGRLVETDIEDRLISTPLETIKNLKNVVGVAAGPSKVTAIKAALTGGYLDILITDELTAGALTAEE